MRSPMLLAAAVVPVLATAGCGQSATGGVKPPAAPSYAAARHLGQAVRLSDGSGDVARLALRAVRQRAGTRALTMHLRVVAGQPGYAASPVVIGTDHHTYFAKSNDSPPDTTDITVAMPRRVRVACVRDTIDGATRVAQWRISGAGCPQ